jgi:hypothetical protein
MQQATRCLSKDSAAQVRSEIREHYESGREAAMSAGAASEDADRTALAALGDARAANRQYRHVLLTSAEASMLRDGNWEARVICSRGWVKRMALAVPIVAVVAAAVLFLAGAYAALPVLMVGIVMSPLLAAMVLPVYTPWRGRVFRCLKWVAIVGALVLAFGPDALKWSWLLASCLAPLAWTEWTRASIRRKLPAEKWPRQLYL